MEHGVWSKARFFGFADKLDVIFYGVTVCFILYMYSSGWTGTESGKLIGISYLGSRMVHPHVIGCCAKIGFNSFYLLLIFTVYGIGLICEC
jgi:hypothetical protein